MSIIFIIFSHTYLLLKLSKNIGEIVKSQKTAAKYYNYLSEAIIQAKQWDYKYDSWFIDFSEHVSRRNSIKLCFYRGNKVISFQWK